MVIKGRAFFGRALPRAVLAAGIVFPPPKGIPRRVKSSRAVRLLFTLIRMRAASESDSKPFESTFPYSHAEITSRPKMVFDDRSFIPGEDPLVDY